MGKHQVIGHFYSFPEDIRRAMDEPGNRGWHWIREGIVYCFETRQSFKADNLHDPKKCRYCGALLKRHQNLVSWA